MKMALWTRQVKMAALLLPLAASPLQASEVAAPPGQQMHHHSAGGAESGEAVELSIVYTADVWSNLSGGLRQGERYLDNLDVTLTLDAEQLIGWEGATFFVYGLYNNGESLSEDLVGDMQVVSNIDAGTQAARLYEAWLEQRFAGDRASLKFGLYDLNSEFDTNDSAALFINSSHGIGPDFAQSGLNGPSIFPVTSLAVRADYRFSDNLLLRAAVLDGVPGDPDHPKRTAIKLGNGDGALLAAELEYRDEATKVAIGHWRYTVAHEAFDLGGGADQLKNTGVYAMIERKLLAEADGDQGLSAWLRVGGARARLNPISRYIGSGLVYQGLVPGRDEDRLGLAVAWAELGGPYRRAAELAGEPTGQREVNVELTYRAPIAPWLTLQPDVQYVVNPGGSRAVGDALVVGLRVEAGF